MATKRRQADVEIAGTVLHVLGAVVFVVVLFGGAFSTLLGIPGTLIVFVDALIYSACTGWKIPLWVLGVLLGLSLIAEIADNVLGAAGVKKYGGSSKGMMWAFAGGLVGAFAVGAVLGPPLGLIGAVAAPLLGGIVGGFVGGYAYERRQGKTAEEARRAGWGAVVGRVMGVMLKTVIAASMVVVALTAAF
jgi:uncharacterized protein YqgC (DUF456 family)